MKMDTLGIWMNITCALCRESDWKTICKMSIAYGKDYIRFYNENMPTPLKINDIYQLRTEINCKNKTEINTHNVIIRKITQNNGKYEILMHHLLEPDEEENEIIIACPLVRSGKNKSIPMYFSVIFDEKELYSNFICHEHFFGQIIYKRI